MIKSTRRLIQDAKRETYHILQVDVPDYFNIKRFRSDFRDISPENRQNFLQQMNNEIITKSVFIVITRVFLNLTLMIREAVRIKYIENIKNQFQPLQNPKELAQYVLNEFFERICDFGYKNVHLFIRSRLSMIQTDPAQLVSVEDFTKVFKDIYDRISTLDSQDLIKPNDNQRISEIAFRHLSNLNNNNIFRHTRSYDQLFESTMQFTDFADIMIYQEKNDTFLQSIKQMVFLVDRPLSVNQKIYDLVIYWLGDIEESKYFQDHEYLLRVIEKNDASCRQERYCPVLYKINEEDEEEKQEISPPMNGRYVPSKMKFDDNNNSPLSSPLNPEERYLNELTESKILLKEYLLQQCSESIDLIKSINFQLIFQFAISHELQSIQELLNITSQGRIMQSHILKVYKLTEQYLNQDNWIEQYFYSQFKRYRFQGPDQLVKLKKYLLSSKQIFRKNYIDNACFEFLMLYLQ